jgi:hypothetical protein
MIHNPYSARGIQRSIFIASLTSVGSVGVGRHVYPPTMTHTQEGLPAAKLLFFLPSLHMNGWRSIDLNGRSFFLHVQRH